MRAIRQSGSGGEAVLSRLYLIPEFRSLVFRPKSDRLLCIPKFPEIILAKFWRFYTYPIVFSQTESASRVHA